MVILTDTASRRKFRAFSVKTNLLNTNMNNLSQWQDPDDILEALNMKNIAVVGLSSNRLRDSNIVSNYLLENNYQVTPVNPNEDEVLA